MACIVPGPVHCYSFTKCMRWILLGSEDGYIRKYDFYSSMNGKAQLTLSQRHNFMDAITKAGVVQSYWDNEVYRQRPDMLAPNPPPYEYSFSPVYAVEIQSRGVWSLSGLDNGDINLYTVRYDEGKCHTALKHHKKQISVLKLLPDESNALSGSWDQTIARWDLNTGQVVTQYEGHLSQITAINLLPNNNGNVFLSTSMDGQSKIFDIRQGENGSLVQNISLPEKCPPMCKTSALGPDGNKVYHGRRNNTVDEYDIKMGSFTRVLKLPNNSGPVSCVACHPYYDLLLCGSTDNLRMWWLSADYDPNNQDLVPFQIVPGHNSGLLSQMGFSENGEYLISSSGDRGWGGNSTNSAIFYTVKKKQ